MLDLDIRLVLDLSTKLGLIPDLDIGLGHRRGFSVAGRRFIGRTRSDIRIWSWGLGLGSGYPDVN